MKFRTILALAAMSGVLALSSTPALAAEEASTQIIYRGEAESFTPAPSQYFTGNVTLKRMFSPKHPDAPFSAGLVRFAAGARSHWHTHPTGQHLVVTEGVGLTGTVDGKVETFKAGDALWCPAGVKHWHGAAPDSAMTHIALTGALPDGSNVEWMEAVTDEQYKGGK